MAGQFHGKKSAARPASPACLCAKVFSAVRVAPRTTTVARRLNQSALAKIADVSTGRAFDHVDGELEQANFPGIVYALDDGAERFLLVFDLRFGAGDHCLDGIVKHALGYIGLAKLKTVAEHGCVTRVLAQLIDITLRFFAKSFEQ